MTNCADCKKRFKEALHDCPRRPRTIREKILDLKQFPKDPDYSGYNRAIDDVLEIL